ncbi:hypothetical protein, partial [Tabrizicola sp.]|uniref:hypothetical protein n=1 Tax=Tabrizicola sp. TaxID=2005166 RepID=UPI0035AE3E06
MLLDVERVPVQKQRLEPAHLGPLGQRLAEQQPHGAGAAPQPGEEVGHLDQLGAAVNRAGVQQ